MSLFTVQVTPAVASDSGGGVWIPYRRWSIWLGVVSRAVLRVEVMELPGRGMWLVMLDERVKEEGIWRLVWFGI